MTLARVTTWSVGQVLTSTALNNEFDNILNNPTSLINAMTGAAGDLWRASGTNAWGRLAVGTTNQFLCVQTGTPTWVSAPIATLGNIGTTSTDGFSLEPATGAGQQWSPRVRWLGWTSTVREDWWAEAQTQAASAGAWVLSSRENLGATVARLTVDITNTRLNIPSGWVYAINGTQIAASNLSNGTTGTAGTAVVLATSPTLVTPTLGDATATSVGVTGVASGNFTSRMVFNEFGGQGIITCWGPDAVTRGSWKVAIIENDAGNQIDAISVDNAGQTTFGGAIRWGVGNAALGGGAGATLGTIGGSGPAAAAQASWLLVKRSDGTQGFVPFWV